MRRDEDEELEARDVQKIESYRFLIDCREKVSKENKFGVSQVCDLAN